jgi:hypothetical protein
MSRFNTNQNHPLIPREHTFFLERKLISVHSYDRDIKKWPNANHFEIMLPESLKNIQSIRLDAISLPSNQYVFSNEYQNTKLSFSLEPFSSTQKILSITINDGSYSPDELANEIQTKMNSAVVEDNPTLAPYDGFKCKYNKVSNTFWFGNEIEHFVLRFDIKQVYIGICNGQEPMFEHYTKWGLPAYLGYKKAIYSARKTPLQYKPSGIIPEGGIFGFEYEYPVVWLNGTENWSVDVENPYPAEYYLSEDNVSEILSDNSQLIDASGVLKDWQKKNEICNLDIAGDDVIYMEIDRYNSMDEIAPYSENSTGVYNNDYHGKVKSAFAKIPVSNKAFSQVIDSKNSSLMNVSFYEPPLERLTRLKFKFRYHDGRLVDFKCLPLSFSLEFNMLKDEQLRRRNVRMSGLYR